MEPIPNIQIDLDSGFRGGQRQVELLCKGLVKRGHPTTLLTKVKSRLGDRLQAAGVNVLRINPGFEFDPLAARTAAKIIGKENPLIVGMHSSHAHALGVMARVMGAKGPKYIVTRRVDFAPGKSLINRWKYIKAPDAYIAISTGVGLELEKAGVAEEKLNLVHSGVPAVLVPEGARRSVLVELGAPPNAILIGNVASLVDHKGHKYLINAVPKVLDRYPNAIFLVAGEGELKRQLMSQAEQLKLSKKTFRFLGHREDIPRILGALDLFVMTSHLEGLCTSIIDAQFSGVPVVATEAGGIPDLVQVGFSGYLAENKNPESIAESILAALSQPELTAKLAENAKAKALEKFTDDAMVEGTLAVYRKILGR